MRKFQNGRLLSTAKICCNLDIIISGTVIRRLTTKVLTLQNMNQNLVKLDFPLQNPNVKHADEITQLKNGATKPYKEVFKMHIGDAQAMGQMPITYIREVLACVMYPELIEKYNFKDDAKQRAQDILNACGGKSIGSYSAAHGNELIRRQVAEYIEHRDGHPSYWKNICLTSGSTIPIKNCLQLFCNEGRKTGVMIPAPYCPIYPSTLTEFGLSQVNYYLDEETNWGLDEVELERSIAEGQKRCDVRALVVINPGNPTGKVLTRDNIEALIKFAYKHKLLILSDEVYQDNVYGDSKFISFKKVLEEMADPYNKQELVSVMSVSKGYVGECGFRGGWAEYTNLDPTVQAHLLKTIEIAMLCPATLGQAVVSCLAKPPKMGDPSFDLWYKEKTTILNSLNEKAEIMQDTFNAIEGISCQSIQGSLYGFPRVHLPSKAVEAARKLRLYPDAYYASKLLESTGICVVPGSSFGQKPGTWHFRTSLLPPTTLLRKMLRTFESFHQKFDMEHA